MSRTGVRAIRRSGLGRLTLGIAVCAHSLMGAPSGGIPENPLLKQGYDDMYNLQFAGAHRAFHQYEESHPKDAMGPVSDAAAYLFQEFNRLHVLRSDLFVSDSTYLRAKKLSPDPKVKAAFEEDLQRADQLAARALSESPNDRTALLASALRYALHANYEALIAKENMQALRDIKQAQRVGDELLQQCPECYDANLAIGVENYLLSQKAAPVRWLLDLTGAQTDKKAGLERLRIVAEKGMYLKPYAKVLLAIAALRDGNKHDAKVLLTDLAQEFPKNAVFHDELSKLS
ncbi:MAG: hypothetical protein JO033_23835 [Acidobacteriaceae bacterium]|nr:hypothetical protein [Acidobacteriaceae bacterium]MBV9501129.1 hypothetical protein [Acidobacteriaceae bacterium]